MPYQLVQPVIERSVRGLCIKPYHGHPCGCPNFNKRSACPPTAPLFDEYFNTTEVYAIWNCFDFIGHVNRMKSRHPDYTDRQLENCLYWQGTARKQLREEIKHFRQQISGWGAGMDAVVGDYPGPARLVVTCPEAMGVNVTATMQGIGVDLQWPPKTVTIQVALAARRR